MLAVFEQQNELSTVALIGVVAALVLTIIVGLITLLYTIKFIRIFAVAMGILVAIISFVAVWELLVV